MGGIVSRRRPILNADPQGPQSPCQKALSTPPILHKILRHVLQTPQSPDLSASEARGLRLVCRLWNQEICSTFFWLRQPLLHFTLSCRNDNPFQEFLNKLGIQEGTLHSAVALPPFALTLDKFLLDSVNEAVQLERTLEALLLYMDGACVLLELNLVDLVDTEELEASLVLPAMPLPALMEFPLLKKINVELSRVQDTDHALKLAKFVQQIVNASGNLSEFSFKAVQWPSEEVTKLEFKNSKRLRRLELVDAQLPLEDNGGLSKLTSLTVVSTEIAGIQENGLIGTLTSCRGFLEDLKISNVHGPQAIRLNLDKWPVMTSLKRFHVMGRISLENPLDGNTTMEIRNKFPALEAFQEEGNSLDLDRFEEVQDEPEIDIPPGMELIERLEEIIQVVVVVSMISFHAGSEPDWKWDDNRSLLWNFLDLVWNGVD